MSDTDRNTVAAEAAPGQSTPASVEAESAVTDFCVLVAVIVDAARVDDPRQYVHAGFTALMRDHDDARAIRSTRLISQAYRAEPADWQPIDTAPKDEWILGYDCGAMLPMMFDTADFKKRWSSGGCGYSPTHWMPLPAPPTGESA